MTAELLVNVTPSETRVAYIDGGILQEIHIEREATATEMAAQPACRPSWREAGTPYPPETPSEG
ncbi:hypothetical protein MJI95_28235, partial [Salmonella enterica subsp. enterica serovar Kentucky]|nr:hypothetical protein [Salmonella enterica subsp. enterica serovar Kentucky]